MFRQVKLGLLTVSSVVLSGGSLMMWSRDARIAVLSAVFFAVVAVVLGFQFREQWRFEHPRPLDVPFDEWIAASPFQARVASVAFLLVGTLPFVLPEFFADADVKFFCFAGAALGAVGLVLSFTRARRSEAVRFTRNSIEFRGRVPCTFTFDNVREVISTTIGGTITLSLVPNDLNELLETVPAEQRSKVKKAFASAEDLNGAPVSFTPSRFGLDAGGLVRALEEGRIR